MLLYCIVTEILMHRPLWNETNTRFSLEIHTVQQDLQRCFLHPLPKTGAATTATSAYEESGDGYFHI